MENEVRKQANNAATVSRWLYLNSKSRITKYMYLQAIITYEAETIRNIRNKENAKRTYIKTFGAITGYTPNDT